MTITLAFDPARVTGWAIVRDGRLVSHGTVDNGAGSRDADTVFSVVFAELAGARPTSIAIEEPYLPRPKRNEGEPAEAYVKRILGRGADAGNVYHRAGCIRGACGAAWGSDVRFWTPLATQWRAQLGLNKGSRKREDVMERCWLWAVAEVARCKTRGKGALTTRGRNGAIHKLYDEAMAIGIATACDFLHRQNGRVRP